MFIAIVPCLFVWDCWEQSMVGLAGGQIVCLNAKYLQNR